MTYDDNDDMLHGFANLFSQLAMTLSSLPHMSLADVQQSDPLRHQEAPRTLELQASFKFTMQGW